MCRYAGDALISDSLVEKLRVAGDSWCDGFRCRETGYCIASKLSCNKMPNCGKDDDSDEANCECRMDAVTWSLQLILTVHLRLSNIHISVLTLFG